jgi:nitroimidazol reductase NimA-like FMN-containing flavoprotein (pyridoxamine 5'-phosphate oxidase superfamily)
MEHEAPTSTEIRRYAWLQRHDREDLYRVLDSGLIAHVGYVRDQVPVVIPMAYARDGHTILMHGSTGAGLSLTAKTGVTLSATVTILDGLVYEHSLYASTVNYRSAMVFGSAFAVEEAEREDAVRVISERLMPGRWAETPRPTKKELAATFILRLPLDFASVKIRSGGPSEGPVEGLWTGHVPIRSTIGTPVAQPGVTVPISDSVPAAIAHFARQFSEIPDADSSAAR